MTTLQKNPVKKRRPVGVSMTRMLTMSSRLNNSLSLTLPGKSEITSLNQPAYGEIYSLNYLCVVIFQFNINYKFTSNTISLNV